MYVQIRQLNRHVYDCFFGTGFDQWSRVKRNHWGFSVLAGNKLTKPELKNVGNAIGLHPFGTIDSVELL